MAPSFEVLAQLAEGYLGRQPWFRSTIAGEGRATIELVRAELVARMALRDCHASCSGAASATSNCSSAGGPRCGRGVLRNEEGSLLGAASSGDDGVVVTEQHWPTAPAMPRDSRGRVRWDRDRGAGASGGLPRLARLAGVRRAPLHEDLPRARGRLASGDRGPLRAAGGRLRRGPRPARAVAATAIVRPRARAPLPALGARGTAARADLAPGPPRARAAGRASRGRASTSTVRSIRTRRWPPRAATSPARWPVSAP